MPVLLTRYIRSFANLHRNKHPLLGAAPHKPVLLLAILDGIARGDIRANKIQLTPELVASFRAYWRALVPEGTWNDRVVYPFRYLVHEKFWRLEKDGREVSASEIGHPTSIGQLGTVVDAGRFADDLWVLLQDQQAQSMLRKALFDTYFTGTGAVPAAEMLVVDHLAQEAQRLIDDSRQSRFRRQPMPKVIRESDAAYLRHGLFPTVVRKLYNDVCAVCRLSVGDDSGLSLVDAAHIMPFSRFGNDDPRNGIALCPSHHRGFDAGWLSASDEYTLLVSPTLSGEVPAYAEAGTRLVLPTLAEFAPARDALAWHRQNVLRM